MVSALAVLSLAALSLAAPLSLVLPAGFQPATTGAVAPAALGDSLAHLLLAAPNAASALPRPVPFVPISASAVSSHVLVFEGFSSEMLDSMPAFKALLASRAVVDADCSSGCLETALAEPERLADRVAYYAKAEVLLTTAKSNLGALLAPKRFQASFPESLASEGVLETCGAAAADVALLPADAADELAVVCRFAAAPKAGLTLLPISSLSTFASLSEEARAAAFRVADAVFTKYMGVEATARTVVSVVFSAEAAPAPAVHKARSVATPVRAARTYTPGKATVVADKNAGKKQILIWLPVVLIVAAVTGFVVMFGVGVDACKDTLLFRTTATFH